MSDDIRPRTIHVHKYFFAQAKTAFEPMMDEDGAILVKGKVAYEMKEYQYLSCSCGEGFKRVLPIRE